MCVESLRPGRRDVANAFGVGLLVSWDPDSCIGPETPLLPAFGLLAVQALRRVESPGSEWYQLWDEAGSLADAVESLDRIRSALS